MIKVRSVDHFKRIKSEDGLKLYEYKLTLSNGNVLEGDDYLTAQGSYNKAKEALIGLTESMINEDWSMT